MCRVIDIKEFNAGHPCAKIKPDTPYAPANYNHWSFVHLQHLHDAEPEARHWNVVRAICFYSDRSDVDWYKFDLELLVDNGSDFEKHEYLSVVISKDATKPLTMLKHEYGTGGNAINH